MQRKDDAGLSEVIGVMLVTAITAVLAGVVVFLVHEFTSDDSRPDPPPALGVAQQPDSPSVRIIKIPNGINLEWVRDIQTTGSCVPTLNGGPFPTMAGTPVEFGDVVGCAGGDSLRLVYVADSSSTLLYRFEFD